MVFPENPSEGQLLEANGINFIYEDGVWTTVVDGSGIPLFEAQGQQGPQGATGASGPQGLKGDPGPAGPAGPDNQINCQIAQDSGEYFPVFVDSVSTTNPRVATNAGNPSNTRFSFFPSQGELRVRKLTNPQPEDFEIRGNGVRVIYGSSGQYGVFFGSGGPLRPLGNNIVSLGNGSNKWSQIFAVNGTINTSDEREKNTITDSVLGADFIRSLRPVSYKWNEGTNYPDGTSTPGLRTHYGFIAQEVKAAVDASGAGDFGGWILADKENADSSQGLRYSEFIAPLTKALQEALDEIDSLKERVAQLEGQWYNWHTDLPHRGVFYYNQWNRLYTCLVYLICF